MSALTQAVGHCLDAKILTANLSEAQTLWLSRRWLHPPLAAGARRQLTIEGGPLPSVPLGSSTRAVSLDGETVTVQEHGTQLWLGTEFCPDEGLWLNLQNPAQATLRAAPQARSEAAWWLALAEAHRAAGWLPLHAALVAEGEQAAAISGVSGAGKSTAALRLVGAGYRLLAEDQTWVRGADALAAGMDTCLRAYPQSVAQFAPHLLSGAQEQDIHGKLMLPVLQPGGTATLRQVLLLTRNGNTPYSRAEQVRAVWEASGVPLTGAGRQAAAQAVGALLQQVTVSAATRETVMTQVGAALDG